MFTKRHFQSIAGAIATLDNGSDAAHMALICVRIFTADNARFNASKFYQACGLNADGQSTRDDPAPFVAIKLNAKNDTNGNPRRVYVVIETSTGDLYDAVEEGYANDIEDLRRQYPGIAHPCEFPTTPGEYRDLLKLGEKKRTKRERDIATIKMTPDDMGV